MAELNAYGKQKNSKLSDETVKKIEEACAIGASIMEICYYADISKETYYNWIEEFPELREKFDRLRQRPVLKARQEVVKGLDNNPEFSLKVLERLKGDEFSLKTEQKLTGAVATRQMTDEEFDKVLEDYNKSKENGESNPEGVESGAESPSNAENIQ